MFQTMFNHFGYKKEKSKIFMKFFPYTQFRLLPCP